ncbi:hypothetical protein [Maribacter sp. Hel_I_7]|nr:hypothetical protein [Maribacter sp. Hel_I_7]
MISNKTYILFFLLLFTYVNTFAQVKIGDDVSTINATSLLELESTSKVLVLTRVTNAQMLSIMPLKGALVYNIDSKCVHLFNGTLWQNICNSSNNAITITDNNDGSYTLTSSDGTTFT